LSAIKEASRSFMKKQGIIEKLEKSLSEEAVNRVKKEAEESILKIKLAELREMQGQKQIENEEFSQASLSKIENRKDIKLSTLKNYLHSIGMEIEIKVRPKGTRSKSKEIVLLKE